MRLSSIYLFFPIFNLFFHLSSFSVFTCSLYCFFFFLCPSYSLFSPTIYSKFCCSSICFFYHSFSFGPSVFLLAIPFFFNFLFISFFYPLLSFFSSFLFISFCFSFILFLFCYFNLSFFLPTSASFF